MKLEVVPVPDVVTDRGFRVVQLIPPGSECSIIFGNEVASATPGSVRGLHLVVFDIEEARADLVSHGVGPALRGRGYPEFFDVIPSRASSSAIRARACASTVFSWALSAASSSHEGGGGPRGWGALRSRHATPLYAGMPDAITTGNTETAPVKQRGEKAQRLLVGANTHGYL